MGLADLHIHTTYSLDGTSSISAVLKYAAHHTRLDVIAITDHDRIDGALKALDKAPSYGIEVIPGIEVSSAEGHVLALFVSQVIPSGLTLEQTVLKTVELGGLCIVPHPMMSNRMGVNPHVIRRALGDPNVASGLVGYEYYNAGLSGSQRDAYAQSLAQQLPLAQVGSSDAHLNWMIGMGATSFPGISAMDVRKALINRQVKAQMFGQMSIFDFVVRYIPRLVLRYTGWVSWNKAPSEPLQMAWLSQRLRALAPEPTTINYKQRHFDMGQNILLICGSLNQTTMMHQIANHLTQYECFFSPFYADGWLKWLSQRGLLNFSILGGRHLKNTLAYLSQNQLAVDYGGQARSYDIVITCTDLVIQQNIRGKRLILVQEGMTEPENLLYHLVRRLKLPLFLANTAATGLSDGYDLFCVASQGYQDLFIRKGVRPEKIAVTGIPNFDHAEAYRHNDFPYRDFVLAATSSIRETFNPDDRLAFIRRVLKISGGRQLIFKLHPNENAARATREIRSLAPDALIFTEGNVNHMIANCSVLITQYSSVVYVGLALGKEVYSYFDVNMLRRLLPIQNNGTSARHIADLCRQLMHIPQTELIAARSNYARRPVWKLPSTT